MKRFLIRFAAAALAAFFIAGSALAQNLGTISNHAVPIGKGAGFQGFTSVAPGTATLPLVSNGASSDPSFQFLPATGGGTGLTTFAIGDLLQANATTTLARLAAVATGNVLLSGGVGVVSSWGKVGLTTHVSGNLPVANGGTGSTAIGQLPGTATNDNASAGNIGEYVSASIAVGSATALTTATPINLTSISLTAGDWDVYFEPSFLFPASTSYTQLVASISTTTVTIDNSSGENYGSIASAANVPGAATNISVRVGPRRMSLSGTTTVFGVLTQAFSASTLSAWGTLRARRVR